MRFSVALPPFRIPGYLLAWTFMSLPAALSHLRFSNTPGLPSECPLPIEDARAHGNLRPWTEEPTCIDARTDRHAFRAGREGSTPNPTFCLFSQSSFQDNLGMSVITSPEDAADIVGTGAFGPWKTSWQRQMQLQGRHRAPQPGPVTSSEDPPYDVQPLPGKGMGAIASRSIATGETFMLDYPAVLVETNFFSPEISPQVRETFLTSAVERLPEETRSKILSLSRNSGDANRKVGNPLVEIMETNTCGVLLGDKIPHLGLFPEVSRINHACEPNAFYRFSRRTLAMEVIAFRDIQPGEEISINYAPLGMPHKIRRDFLKAHWGFDCQCISCLAAPKIRAASDTRRMAIAKGRERMTEARNQDRLRDAVREAEQLLYLLKEEQLWPLLPEYHVILAELLFELGDSEAAKTYAEMGLHGWLELRGDDSSHVEDVRHLLRRIRRAPPS